MAWYQLFQLFQCRTPADKTVSQDPTLEARILVNIRGICVHPGAKQTVSQSSYRVYILQRKSNEKKRQVQYTKV